MTTDALTKRERERLARRAQMLDLYDAGASVTEIAEVLEVTTQAVYQMLQALDLPAPTKKDTP